MNKKNKEFKGAIRIIAIWVTLFLLSVLFISIILYQGIVRAPSSAVYLKHFDTPDALKTWDDFKTNQPSLDPSLLSSPYQPELNVWINISFPSLWNEIILPKTVVSIDVSVKSNFLDKSVLKLQSLLVLLLDQNEKVKGKLYTQQSAPDFFLSGKNETNFTFWFNVPSDMQNQKYTIIVELFGLVDTSQSINYQRLHEESYYIDENYGIYGSLPGWNYRYPNQAYFKFLAYERVDAHAPFVFSILSLALYSWTFASVISTVITIIIEFRIRKKNGELG